MVRQPSVRWVLRAASIPIVVLALGASPAHTKERSKPDAIVFETDPGYCMGDCNWYRLTVTADGKARMKIYHNNDLVRGRTVRLTDVQYQTFRSRLAMYRPVGDRFLYEGGDCDQVMTDMGGYHVTWKDHGPPARLVLNDGCVSDRLVAMHRALSGAAASLGFSEVPGPSDGVMASSVMDTAHDN